MRLFFLCGFLTFCTTIFASDTSAFQGHWKASQKGDYYHFYFENDSIMKIVHYTDTTLIHYFIDTTQNPMHIDMKIIDRMTGEALYTNFGIFTWMTSTRFRLRMSEIMKDRPKSFLPKGNTDTYILVKQ